MQVRDVLKTKPSRVFSIMPAGTVAEAIRLMVDHNIGSLPVLDQASEIVGVFSERDVIRGVHKHGDEFLKFAMADVMTPNPVTCQPDDDVQDAMRKMSEYRVAKLPVIAGRKLVGVVSVGDLNKLMSERLREENGHLMTYLYGQV